METVMTDYQFKAILKMVIKIAEKSEDKEDILKQMKELLDEQKMNPD